MVNSEIAILICRGSLTGALQGNSSGGYGFAVLIDDLSFDGE